MGKYRRDLAKLSRALRGDVSEIDDWPTILSLANETLVTPELYVRLQDLSQAPNQEGPPEDVERFVL